MYKKINLPVCGYLAVGLFVTGCSQYPDIQSASTVVSPAIDAQIQSVIVPEPVPAPPKVYQAPTPPKMVKPIQRMVKPIQRMPKPIARPRMLKPVQRMMSKPIQRQY